MKAFFSWLLPLVFLATAFDAYAQNYDCEEELFSKKDKPTRLFGYVNAIGEYRIPPVFLRALPFVGKNAIVQQGKLFGVINCEGRLVVPADYEQITGFTSGKGWAKKGGLWGLIDSKGKLLIQPLYEEVKEVNPVSGTVSWVKKSGLWGLISKENGRFVVPVKYEDVSNLSDSAGIGRLNGRADLIYYGDGRVIIQNIREMRKLQGQLFAYQSEDRKWGAFNSLAYMLIRPRWDTLFLNSPLVQVQIGGNNALLSLRGAEILSPEFQMITPFAGGYAAVMKNGLAGVVNPAGKFEADGLVYEKAMVNGLEGTAVLVKNGKAGLWSFRARKWLFPIEYQFIVHSYKWLLLTQNKKTKAFDLSRNQSSQIEWDSVKIMTREGAGIGFKEGKVWWCRFGMDEGMVGPYERLIPLSSGFSIPGQGNRNGVLDPSGKLIVPIDYERVALTRSGQWFRLTNEGKTSISDKIGRILTTPPHEDAFPTYTGRIWLLKTKGKWGIADDKGNWLLEAKFDSIAGQVYKNEEFKPPFIAYRKGKGQLINEKGMPVSDAEIGQWLDLKEGRIALRTEKGFRLFSYDGKPQADNLFDEITSFSEGNAPAKISGKWGFVNLFGKMVIPAQYEAVMHFENGIGYAQLDGKWGVLRRNGKWLVKPVGQSVAIDVSGKRKLVMP